MLREKLVHHHEPKPGEFRWRSREISRIEGLSDAVFGFAITLLIVALEVPRTSEELLHTMRGFVAFAVTFAILYSLWYQQFVFFRRYALDDKVTVALNGALLFMVLFFIFPLKFLLGTLIGRLMGDPRTIRLPDGTLERVIRPEHFLPMMTVYGLGTSAVFGILALLFLHAYRQRERLGLDELELADTRLSMLSCSFSFVMGLLVVVQAVVLHYTDGTPYEKPGALWTSVVLFAFVAFLLITVRRRKRRRKELVARLIAEGELRPDDPEI